MANFAVTVACGRAQESTLQRDQLAHRHHPQPEIKGQIIALPLGLNAARVFEIGFLQHVGCVQSPLQATIQSKREHPPQARLELVKEQYLGLPLATHGLRYSIRRRLACTCILPGDERPSSRHASTSFASASLLDY